MSQFSVKWIFVLNCKFEYNIKPHLPPDFTNGCAFEDSRGKRWLEIYPDGRLRILKGYAWDGCTPKFSLWDIVFGTPDGIPSEKTRKPKAYHASLVHDVLYQFLDADLPVSRKGADQIFLELLTEQDFGPRKMYYWAVRIFGGIARLETRWKRSYNGKRVTL